MTPGEILFELMSINAMEKAINDNQAFKNFLDLLKKYGITGSKAIAFMLDLSMLDLSSIDDVSE